LQVQGPKASGVVRIHLIRRNGREEFEYQYFFLDVKGHPRIYLENADAVSKTGEKGKGFKLFGVKWA
jgi:import inner membrane translocase subunit TIM21